jgi:hypothetical protein
MSQTKKCSGCGVEQERDEFYRDANHSDGLTSACKSCMKARATRWQRDNPGRYRDIRDKYLAKKKREA